MGYLITPFYFVFARVISNSEASMIKCFSLFSSISLPRPCSTSLATLPVTDPEEGCASMFDCQIQAKENN